MLDLSKETIKETLKEFTACGLISGFNITSSDDQTITIVLSMSQTLMELSLTIPRDSDEVDAAILLLRDMTRIGIIDFYDVIGNEGNLGLWLSILYKTSAMDTHSEIVVVPAAEWF